MPKVSVVIPVYNKEEYVGACLENVLQQDFDSYEVICVDDGSTDKSGEICDQWAAKDDKIRVFHTENGGVTAARRKGVEESDSKYIVFVDSDDQLLPHALEVLYEAIEQTQADEVFGRFITQKGEKSPVLYEGEIADLTPVVEAIVMNRNKFPILWGLIFRKDVVKDCLDTPREIVEGEDLLMQLKVLMKHPRVYFIKDCVYMYNVGIPNYRKRLLKREILYDKLLRQVLDPEWENYQSAFVHHQIKQYEEFVVRGEYNAYEDYYKEAIPSPLPKEVPLLWRFFWHLPLALDIIAYRIYKRLVV